MALTIILGDSLLKRALEKKHMHTNSLIWKVKAGAEAKDAENMMLDIVRENPSKRFQVISCLSYNNHRDYKGAINDLKKIKEVRNVTKVLYMKPPLSHRSFVAFKKNPNSLQYKKQLDSYDELVSFMENENFGNDTGNMFKKFIYSRKAEHFALDFYHFSEKKADSIVDAIEKKQKQGNLF